MGETSDGWRRPVLIWTLSLVALVLLGLGIYAVFHSKNGAGTAALLAIGPLALFVVVFHDRIKSMQVGGAGVQLATQVKYSLKRAFQLRLAGNYEGAEAEIDRAFDRFVWEEPKMREAYAASKDYQRTVLMLLGRYVELNFKGQVRETSSTVSFLPLMDAVMTADGDCVVAELKLHKKDLCETLTRRLNEDRILKTAVVVRPGPDLDTVKLVDRLEQEVTHGALGIDCFLLIQNCKDSDSRKEFCELIFRRGMHAKSLVWEPSSGTGLLESAFLEAILTICEPGRCGFIQAPEAPQ
jgi:hypothetical protein